MNSPSVKDNDGSRRKRTPDGTKRVFGVLAFVAVLALLYYVNIVLPESALVVGKKVRGAAAVPAGPPPTMLSEGQVQALMARGPPTGVGDPLEPPREPNTAICNESVLEGVMTVARQQADRATAMYEDERKRREAQDRELETLKAQVEQLAAELRQFKPAAAAPAAPAT